MILWWTNPDCNPRSPLLSKEFDSPPTSYFFVNTIIFLPKNCPSQLSKCYGLFVSDFSDLVWSSRALEIHFRGWVPRQHIKWSLGVPGWVSYIFSLQCNMLLFWRSATFFYHAIFFWNLWFPIHIKSASFNIHCEEGRIEFTHQTPTFFGFNFSVSWVQKTPQLAFKKHCFGKFNGEKPLLLKKIAPASRQTLYQSSFGKIEVEAKLGIKFVPSFSN